jgi:hypothetical protein
MAEPQDLATNARDKRTLKSLIDDLGASLVVLAGITVASTTVLIIVWQLHPSYNTLGFELAKTSMQALGVITIFNSGGYWV